MKLDVQPDRRLIRAAGNSVRYLRVSVTAPPSPSWETRWPVNVALVLDRSGSMGGRKIALARDAAAQTLRLLGSEDRFALVVYDNEVNLLSASVEATPEARRRALERLARIDARGSTDLSGGWQQGGEQLVGTIAAGAIGMCLLLTDGLANHGITDRTQLIRMAGGLRAQGICTSTFGVGNDFDERLLRGMAEASSGNFHYIEAPEQIPGALTAELGGALDVVARDVVLEVVLPPGVTAEPLNRVRWDRTGDRMQLQLGNLVSRQEVELVIKLAFPSGEAGRQLIATFGIGSSGAAEDGSADEVRWTLASHEENDRQPRDRQVDWAVATQYAGRVREEAVERSREGDLAGARRVLRGTARRIREYAGDEPRLRTLVAQLEAEAEEYGARPFTSQEIKKAIYADYAA